MALYIPAGRRRRRTILFCAATLIVGLAAGIAVGRASAPSIKDRISSVQADARQTAAGLRVLSLHDEAGTVSNQAGSSGGADLVLQRTRSELDQEFTRAAWLGPAQRDELVAALEALKATPDHTSKSFGTAADALAHKIETTFGVTR